jgi:Uma2 family endonuclease
MTATATMIEPPASAVEMAVVLTDIGWDGFETFVDLMGDRRFPRVLYGNRSLTLVSPSLLHEHGSDRLDTVVRAVTYELDLPCQPTGSTLLRRRDLARGIMGDRTYYLTNEARVRARLRNQEELDLNLDPPPDLAIEVEITHPAAGAVETWRLLGVPEVWVYYGLRQGLSILHLDEHGRYVEATASRAFPFLKAGEIQDWVARPATDLETRWERQLRAWVRDELAQRLGNQGQRP